MSFRSTFKDGSIDHTSPNRPGYRFADSDVRDENERLRRERMQRLHNADRGRPFRDDASYSRGGPTLDALQDDANSAYEERRQRLANAHRNRQPDVVEESPFERRERRRREEQKKYDV
jgi:hypothetical protein